MKVGFKVYYSNYRYSWRKCGNKAFIFNCLILQSSKSLPISTSVFCTILFQILAINSFKYWIKNAWVNAFTEMPVSVSVYIELPVSCRNKYGSMRRGQNRTGQPTHRSPTYGGQMYGAALRVQKVDLNKSQLNWTPPQNWTPYFLVLHLSFIFVGLYH